MMITLAYVVIAFSSLHLPTKASNKRFKLSDLPVLKKWEIPSNHFAKHIGRKYKDLDQEKKRSTYWELKPEFTENELAWDEDPEKVKLDFNYKSFFEDDDDDKISGKKGYIPLEQETTYPNFAIGKKSAFFKDVDTASTGEKLLKKAKEVSKRRHVEHSQNKKKHAKKSRSRRSLIEEHDGEEEESVGYLSPSFFLENPTDNDEVDEEIRDKRAAIWSVVRKMQSSQYLQKNKKTSGSEPLKKRQLTKHVVQYPTPFISAKQNVSVVKKSNIVPKPNKELASNRRQKIAIINDIENAKKTVRSVLESKRKLKAGELGDEQGIESKDIRANVQPVKTSKDVKAVSRQNIIRPKTSLNVDPANVARAVSMAMEQLKRDKMWGKVFVHVRPSGQLKVMVQETRRMEDEK